MDDTMLNSLLQPPMGSHAPQFHLMNNVPMPSHIIQCDLNNPIHPIALNHVQVPNEPLILKKTIKDRPKNGFAEVISTKEHMENIKGSPAYYLGLLIDDTIISWLISETNNGGSQLRNFQPVTEEEMRCFIAILYLSGYVDVPRRRMLWERAPDAHCPLVSNAMQRDRFENIFTGLHMGDGMKDDVSRLARLNPLVSELNENFARNAPKDDQHCIAECTVPSGGRHQNTASLKVRTLRVWCGCTRSGYCCWFNPCPLNSPFNDNHSYSRSIILSYAAGLQHRSPGKYTLLFENCYGDLATMCQLQRMGITGSGTDREKTGCLLNPTLGGVDKMDCNIGLYRISIRGKKCFSTLLTYALDLALYNAWKLYRLSQNDEKKQMDLLAFRRNIVIYYLQHYARPISGHRGGRPSRRQIRGKRNCPSEARFDGIRHYVIVQEKQTRCAKCGTKTTTRCQKCDVGVHVKCFVDYHQKPKETNEGG